VVPHSTCSYIFSCLTCFSSVAGQCLEWVGVGYSHYFGNPDAALVWCILAHNFTGRLLIGSVNPSAQNHCFMQKEPCLHLTYQSCEYWCSEYSIESQIDLISYLVCGISFVHMIKELDTWELHDSLQLICRTHSTIIVKKYGYHIPSAINSVPLYSVL
jgi:hypothetical protein